MKQMMAGKKGKYTEKGIKEANCLKCGEPATTQVQPKAEPKWYRPLCTGCAFALESMVLNFLGVPEIDEKMLNYREKLDKKANDDG